MTRLVNKLIHDGYLKTDRIIKAFQKVNRADFLPKELEFDAEADVPLPIGYGQTISQPATVAFMLELLQPQNNDKILDIGAGSGWQTALLCELVGPKGRVFSIERIKELKEFGEKNVKKYNYKNVKFMLGDGYKGLKKYAPFDKIIVAAESLELSPAWKEQLKINGRIVAPLKQNLAIADKISNDEFKIKEYPGFLFVPLIID